MSVKTGSGRAARARRRLAWGVLVTTLLVGAPDVRGETGVAPGSRVRWRSASHGNAWQVGRFAKSSGDTVFLVAPVTGDTFTVATSGLSQFEVSRGRRPHGRTGAWIGGATVVALTLMFVALASIDEGQAIGASDVEAVLMFGAFGAAAGLAVGGLVRTERWESVPDPWAISHSTGSAVFAVRISRSW